MRSSRGSGSCCRPAYLPPDPASRTAYAAGEVAQCDLWFPAVEVPVGFGQTRQASRLPVLVMVTGYARWLSARLIPSRAAEDLFAGWWRLIQGLGGVPRVLVWDGEGAVGQRRRRTTILTEQAHAFRGVLGAKILVCDPGDPEAKGLVEQANGYLETSFLPGRVFASPADFNAQLTGWLMLANQRHRRVLGCAPADRIDADRAAMLPLPPVAPVTGWHTSLRLPRDHYVRLDGNDYSVHPAAVGRRVELRADLDRVRGFCDGRLVADHARCWARHPTLSDPAHLAAAEPGRLRRRLRLGRGRGGGLMPAKTRDLTAEGAFLTRALKAPTLRATTGRLAERARAEGWSHEEFLVACLQREVAAREAHGGEGRIRAARFPAHKSLEEFDIDHARGLRRDLVAHLGTLDFVAARENVVFLGPPGTPARPT
jgi:transposase